MDKPPIGYRSHIFHIIPPATPLVQTIPQLPPGATAHTLKCSAEVD